MQRGIKGAFLNGEQLIGRSLNMEHDAIAVQFAQLRECFQHKQIKTSLQIIPGHFTAPLDNLALARVSLEVEVCQGEFLEVRAPRPHIRTYLEADCLRARHSSPVISQISEGRRPET